MDKAEKRYYGEGENDYDIWYYRTVWKKIKEGTVYWDRYEYWLLQGNEPTVIPYIPPKPISWDELKNNKRQEIKSAYMNTRVDDQVQTVNNIVMDGGEYSETNIRVMIDLWEDEESPEPTQMIRDYFNNYHEVTFIEAKQILRDIRLDGKKNLEKKWIIEAEIDNLVEDTPENRKALENISW